MSTKLRLLSSSYSLENSKHEVELFLGVNGAKIIALYGRNGSGKSYLLELICGIKTAFSTRVEIQEKRENWRKLNANEIGYLSQHNFIPPHLTLKKVLSDYNINLHDLVRECSLFALKENYKIKNFSGGEIRLLELYLLLHRESKLLLLDEPFAQLSPLHIQQVKTWMKQSRCVILITDHNFQEVFPLADQHLLLKDKQEIILIENEKELIRGGYISNSIFDHI